MQHTPTVTLGNKGRDNYLLKSLDEYSNLGIDVHHVERGGDVTYHSPGQWVLYPILHLGKKMSIHMATYLILRRLQFKQ